MQDHLGHLAPQSTECFDPLRSARWPIAVCRDVGEETSVLRQHQLIAALVAAARLSLSIVQG